MQERCKPDAVLERVRAVKAWRSQQSERFTQQREARNQRNRHVTRIHERLTRQHSKLKDDDRTRRMDALRVSPPPHDRGHRQFSAASLRRRRGQPIMS